VAVGGFTPIYGKAISAKSGELNCGRMARSGHWGGTYARCFFVSLIRLANLKIVRSRFHFIPSTAPLRATFIAWLSNAGFWFMDDQYNISSYPDALIFELHPFLHSGIFVLNKSN
jgi:hypothetical protein